jgi:GT2 family glycosyltransferase
MIDIVIVNWNSGEYLHKCIFSIVNSDNRDFVGSVFIIDNHSIDSSIMELPDDDKIIVVKNKENTGFSRACNQAFKLCTSSYVLLLNPDTQLLADTLSNCISFMNQNRGIDILGCQLLHENGEISYSCSRFPTPYRIFKDAIGLSRILPSLFKPGIIMSDWDHKESRYVDQVMGAFMFMHTSLFRKIGYFDEQFFVYYEEIDFSKRLNMQGGKSFFNAAIKAIHTGKGTTANVIGYRLFLNLRSRLQYAKKYFGFWGYCSVWICTFLIEPFTRSFFLIISGNAKQVVHIYEGYKLLCRIKFKD